MVIDLLDIVNEHFHNRMLGRCCNERVANDGVRFVLRIWFIHDEKLRPFCSAYDFVNVLAKRNLSYVNIIVERM